MSRHFGILTMYPVFLDFWSPTSPVRRQRSLKLCITIQCSFYLVAAADDRCCHTKKVENQRQHCSLLTDTHPFWWATCNACHGWMASPTRWTCVWVNFGSWWWTGRPGVLRFMGLQRVGHNWATEPNWMFANKNTKTDRSTQSMDHF